MIKLFLRLYAWLLNDGHSAFDDINSILNSKKYPMFGPLNTRTFVFRCLNCYEKRNKFSVIQLQALRRVADG